MGSSHFVATSNCTITAIYHMKNFGGIYYVLREI
nr:MAG TPA: hypothetical protein [Caudoviricetes sp.]DAU20578.1 MAG TPA: hypothetical protein [Caudoviricetes sp.]DAX14516.1 MAG TPA: hypothetical protein [Bacteriophage sp.]